MSYILEALNKSEKERQGRAVPDLQTQPTLYPGVSRSRTGRPKNSVRRLLSTLLAAALGITAVWTFRHHIPVALEIKITNQAALQKNLTASPILDRVIQEEQAYPAQETALSGEPEAPSAGSPPLTMQQQAPIPETPAGERSFDLEEQPEEIIEPASALAIDQAKQAVVSPENIELQPAPIILAENTNSGPTLSAPAIPFLEDLPALIKTDLPKLKFAGHTYSATPKNRMIIINNSIKRQGDPVGPGLRLEEINWNGVILNFKGTRFQVITTN